MAFAAFAAAAQAASMNNQALALSNKGDYEEAEKMQLQTLASKEARLGSHDIGVALTQNALGELWLKMGKLDEADDILKKAIATRNNYGFTGWDAGVTRENLGQVYEAKGDLAEARSIRKSGAPNAICCGFHYCPGQVYELKQLSQCQRCKCIFYCSKSCQTQDWTAGHKERCRPLDKIQASETE